MFSGKTEEFSTTFERAQFARWKYLNPPSILGIMMKWWSHNANEIRSTPVPAAANIAILAQGVMLSVLMKQFLTMKSYGM
jgi:thymidine kinase